MSDQIFICYRRDGGESLAALLYGVIGECNDVLVVLPPNGLDRCIDYPQDWVRQEIEHALALKKNVIPLMMRKG